MRVLRRGSTGNDVVAWQNFLVGEGYPIEATSLFEETTHEATRKWQASKKLQDDGVVGKLTYAKAMVLGFDPLDDDLEGEEGPNWPKMTLPLASFQERVQLFGSIPYTPAPTRTNPEAIFIPTAWAAKNIVSLEVPGVKRLGVKTVLVNQKVADQFKALWQAWDDAGLGGLLKTFDGAWAPRFVRGSRTTLSSHSWASAFDVNASWNGIGKVPPLVGAPGSVRKLVPIAEEHGFAWGGFYRGRPDGMHFEVAKLL